MPTQGGCTPQSADLVKKSTEAPNPLFVSRPLRKGLRSVGLHKLVGALQGVGPEVSLQERSCDRLGVAERWIIVI
jgi:hypothetical protein